MIEANEDLFLQFDPLDLTCSMRTVGGPEKQVYYAESNQYIPNRQLAPLTLQPAIHVVDPHNIIASGDKAGQLASSAWYVGSISDANRVTVMESAATISTPYALGNNGSLVIRKNVTQQSPVNLFFEAEFYDSRRGSNVPISMAALLTTTSNAESEPAPTLALSKPAGWVFNPLAGMSNQTIEAQLFRQGSKVPDTDVIYRWFIVKGSTEWLLGSKETDFLYVSGQNTKVLTVNPEYMKKVRFRCKAEYASGMAVTQEVKFIRRFPASLYARVNVRTGNIVHPSVSSIKLQAEMGTSEGTIANPDQFFFIRWKRNTMTAGSTDVEIGHGANISVSRSVAGITSSQTPRFGFTAEEHDEYQELTDENEEILRDENGEILVGF